jgi:ParB-like chromosome segregation protein Spo0J
MASHFASHSIEQWPIERLVEYPRNPRKNDGAVDRMCGSIREFGFKIPILARSDGEVIDGHLRLKAARKLSLSEVPVLLCDEWTPVQVRAFRLLVNRSATWADFDEELLPLELQDLQEADFDLSLPARSMACWHWTKRKRPTPLRRCPKRRCPAPAISNPTPRSGWSLGSRSSTK